MLNKQFFSASAKTFPFKAPNTRFMRYANQQTNRKNLIYVHIIRFSVYNLIFLLKFVNDNGFVLWCVIYPTDIRELCRYTFL